MRDGTDRRPGWRVAWAAVPVIVALVSVALFAVQLTSGPVSPGSAWLVVPVAGFDLPEQFTPVHLDPGMRLGGNDQLAARAAGAAQDLELSWRVDLGDDGSLHTIVRGQQLRRRDHSEGVSLFLDRSGGVPSGLYHLAPQGAEPLDCSEAVPVGDLPRRVAARIQVQGGTVRAFVNGERIQTCALPGAGGPKIGFRAGLSEVSIAGVELLGPAGRARFADHPEAWGGTLAHVVAIGLGVVVLGLVWLVDGGITRLVVGRGRWVDPLRPTVAYLAFALLPVLGLVDLEGVAAGMRLGRTPLLALQAGLALGAFVVAKFIGLVASSPRFRLGDAAPEPVWDLLRSPSGRVLAAFAVAHAAVVGVLAVVSGGGMLAMAGIDLVAVDAPVTVAGVLAITGVGLAVARWVSREGAGRPFVVLGTAVLSGSALLALASLVGGGLWGARLHLALVALATVGAGLVFAQVNAARIRAYNLVSLVSALSLLVFAECAARQTYLDQGWDPVPVQRFSSHPLLGWVRASHEFDHILDVREPSAYPSEKFPVAFDPEKGTGKTRIVALGSSSTGGAFQMDDLDDFYPAQLGRRLDEVAPGRFEVINQGVGGWNSFLVRLYLGTAIEELDADVITVYLGGNDTNTLGGWTYKDYWETYQRGGGRAPVVRQILNQSRLYVGFKSGLLLLNARGSVSAVPVADARENYTRIIDLAQEHGARVVLMSEGVRPSPARLADYYVMMRDLAAERGELFLDMAAVLHARSQEDLFLDQVHLTLRGHEVVAEELLRFLEDEGIVQPR